MLIPLYLSNLIKCSYRPYETSFIFLLRGTVIFLVFFYICPIVPYAPAFCRVLPIFIKYLIPMYQECLDDDEVWGHSEMSSRTQEASVKFDKFWGNLKEEGLSLLFHVTLCTQFATQIRIQINGAGNVAMLARSQVWNRGPFRQRSLADNVSKLFMPAYISVPERHLAYFGG